MLTMVMMMRMMCCTANGCVWWWWWCYGDAVVGRDRWVKGERIRGQKTNQG